MERNGDEIKSEAIWSKVGERAIKSGDLREPFLLLQCV